MAVLIKPVADDRAQKILDNPKGYYAEARAWAREKVRARDRPRSVPSGTRHAGTAKRSALD